MTTELLTQTLVQEELASFLLGKTITSIDAVDGGRAVHLRVAGCDEVLEVRAGDLLDLSDVTACYRP
jgi:hypothetical protein